MDMDEPSATAQQSEFVLKPQNRGDGDKVDEEKLKES